MKYGSVLLLAIVLLTASYSYSQTMSETGAQTKWLIAGTALAFPNDEVVFPIQIDKKTFGIVRTDSRAAEKWKYDIKDNGRKEFIIDIGKFKGNILVLIGNDGSDNLVYNVITRVEALIIDAATGTLIKQKTIFTYDGKTYLNVALLKNKDGEIQHILVRHTRWDGEEDYGWNKRDENIAGTKKMELFSLAEDLTPTMAQEYGINPDVYLYASRTTPAGDLIMLWVNKNAEFVLERFKGEGVDSRIVLPLEWNRKFGVGVRMKINPANPSQVLFGVNHHKGKENMITTILVDLDQKTTKAFEETINADYRKKLEAEAVIFTPRKKFFFIENFEMQILTDVHFCGDKYVVIKEISSGITGGVMNMSSIVTVVDKDMKALKHFHFDNKFRTPSLAASVESRVSGDKLQFFTLDQAGLSSFHLVYGEIDVKQLQWIKLANVKEGNRQEFSPGFRLHNTVWFPQSALVHQSENQGLIGRLVKGQMKQVSF